MNVKQKSGDPFLIKPLGTLNEKGAAAVLKKATCSNVR